MIIILWVWLALIIPVARGIYGQVHRDMQPTKCKGTWSSCRQGDHLESCYELEPAAGWFGIIAGSILWPVVGTGLLLYALITFKPRKTKAEKLADEKAKTKTAEAKTAEAEAELAKVTAELEAMGKDL